MRLAGFEPTTRCLEGTAHVAGIVRDVYFSSTHDPLSTEIGWAGCYKRRLQGGGALGPGHPFDRRPEFLRGSGPEARRARAATRAQRALLTANMQGFRMRTLEGWPRLQHRTPPLASRRVARAVGPRGECGLAPSGPKGQRKAAGAPARHGPPGGQPATGGLSVAQRSAPPSCGAFAWAAASPGPARGARP